MHELNEILIVASGSTQAKAIHQHIGLRGFDHIDSLGFEQALKHLRQKSVDLLLIDLDKKNKYASEAVELLNLTSENSTALVIADRFEEDVFFNLFDAGARDFLVKPVAGSYLVSRILLALDNLQAKRQTAEWESLLTGLGVLSPLTRVYSRTYFERLIQNELDKLTASPDRYPLSLIALRVDGIALDKAASEPLNGPNLDVIVGKVFRLTGRVRDTVGQWDDQTYVVLLPQTNEEGAYRLVERLLNELSKELSPLLSEAWFNAEEPLPVSLSVQSYDQPLEPDALLTEPLISALLERLKPLSSATLSKR